MRMDIDRDEFDKHVENLQKYCRVCGERVATNIKGGYKNAKHVLFYKDQLLKYYGTNIENDNIRQHPTTVCMKCNAKLYKLLKSDVKDIEAVDNNEQTSGSSSSSVPVQFYLIHQFDAHQSFSKCAICQTASKRGRPKLPHPQQESTPESEFLYSQVAEEIGFKTVDEKNFLIVGNKVIEKEINICSDFTVDVKIYGKLMNKDIQNQLGVATTIDKENALELFSAVMGLNICPGNTDFVDLIQHKLRSSGIQQFKGADKEVIAFMQTESMLTIEDMTVIRHKQCELAFSGSGSRCQVCTSYRSNLFAMRTRIQRRSADKSPPSIFTPDSKLSHEDLLDKLKRLEIEKKSLSERLNRMTKKVSQLLKRDGTELDDETAVIINETLEKNDSPFDPDSPQHLLWEQQKTQSALRDGRGMRWHPLIIRWCLSIYLKSPGTYKNIRESPFLFLPCKNTLLKYINFTDPGCGFNIDIVKKLVNHVKVETLDEFQKNVVLIFDEMKIKSGLVYCKTTGKLVGFTEMGRINDEIEEFGRLCNTDKDDADEDRPIAKYVIVFMVRGICSGLNYSFGHFASEGFESDQIFYCAYEATRILEGIGLKVRAMTADGASPNRKFFNLHRMSEEDNTINGSVYWAKNPWDWERNIYFVCDPPHLVKTTRNNLENSHGNRKTRNLLYEGQEIGWHHIVNVYNWDLGPARHVVGLRMGHKLREEHVNLDPRSRMRVNLAAQVLSKTVADMLAEQDLADTKSTEKFIRLIDKFFDCLNVTARGKNRKADRSSYESANDSRFEWLENDFLEFLDKWEAESKDLDLTKTEKGKLCLSKQTLQGLRITTKSFITLGRLLFAEGAQFLLSEKFSQDPVEEYFSKQRAKRGPDENPDLEAFNRNVLGLNVAGDDLVRAVNGNVRRKNKERAKLDIHDLSRLPTKKTKLE
uniref:Uncharacterized protein n=1 Tax=Clytia hemisphaerica TaxID=252671 RepID=A0A7M6DPD0_9CNID|eukprot:TCONS_00036242-protein